MTSDQVQTIVLSIVSSGTLLGLAQAWLSRRKTRAEATGEEVKAGAHLVDVAVDLLDPLRDEVERLSTRLADCEDTGRKLSGRIGSLETEKQRLETAVSTLEAELAELRRLNRNLRSENAEFRSARG